MPRKSKAETERDEKARSVEAVEADPIAPDMLPTDDREGEEALETDWTKPISADNPPPSKRPRSIEDAPLSDDETLERDRRTVDEELRESEEEVARKTDSKGKATRVTDTNANVANDSGVSSSTK